MILQYCEVTPAEIVAIGEVNDDKFGSFTPGTLIPILPEREVLDMELDYLLVLPWHFRETFLAKQLSPGTRLVFPLPLVEIVGRASEVREWLSRLAAGPDGFVLFLVWLAPDS